MILIIDNYDSFTWNLYQYTGEINHSVQVARNDRITIGEISEMDPSHIIISPGPGYPSSAGISIPLIRELGRRIPILGVCLGHQAIGEAYGGKTVKAVKLVHGKKTPVEIISDCNLFRGISNKIYAGRYHSLIVDKNSLPQQLEITVVSDEGEIMGLRHRQYPVYGIQFHPESILTADGKRIIGNFLNIKHYKYAGNGEEINYV